MFFRPWLVYFKGSTNPQSDTQHSVASTTGYAAMTHLGRRTYWRCIQKCTYMSTISSKIQCIIYAYTCSYYIHANHIFWKKKLCLANPFDQVEVPEPILEFCRPTVLVMTCRNGVWNFESSFGFVFFFPALRIGVSTCITQGCTGPQSNQL